MHARTHTQHMHACSACTAARARALAGEGVVLAGSEAVLQGMDHTSNHTGNTTATGHSPGGREGSKVYAACSRMLLHATLWAGAAACAHVRGVGPWGRGCSLLQPWP